VGTSPLRELHELLDAERQIVGVGDLLIRCLEQLLAGVADNVAEPLVDA
jgi:hypothetical protein